MLIALYSFFYGTYMMYITHFNTLDQSYVVNVSYRFLMLILTLCEAFIRI